MCYGNGAIKQALNMGAIGYNTIKHLVLCRVDKRPPKLNMDTVAKVVTFCSGIVVPFYSVLDRVACLMFSAV